MKKLLVALVATTMTLTAVAGDGQNMVRIYGLEQDSSTGRSVDLSTSSDDVDNKSTHLALNYARAFGQWQVGVSYRSLSSDDGTTKNAGTTIGLSGYYNLESDLANTCYFGLHIMQNKASDGNYSVAGNNIGEDDAAQTIALEYGHRWHVGEAWGLHLTFAPSVMYSTTSYEFDDETTELTTQTALAWNWLKFDVLF